MKTNPNRITRIIIEDADGKTLAIVMRETFETIKSLNKKFVKAVSAVSNATTARVMNHGEKLETIKL